MTLTPVNRSQAYCFMIFLLLLGISSEAQNARSQTSLAFSSDSSRSCQTLGVEYNFLRSKDFDPTKINEPVYIELYNVSKKQLWAPPLYNTRLKTSGFGPRWGHFHHGIDLALNWGAPVFSVFDGSVRLATYGRGYGNYVIIRHDNGLETLYGHLSRLKVRKGQRVKAGQLLGLGGSTGNSTGPHLHFEVRYRGYTLNPQLIYDFKEQDPIRGDKFFIKPHHFRHYGNPSPKQSYLFHEVGQGESLIGIAQHYKVSPQDLAKINRLETLDLEKGQIIRIR